MWSSNKPNGHPAEKPEDLISTLISWSCQSKSVILDAFMGSGTSGVCAVRGCHDFIGIEQDPGWFDYSERRIAEAQSTLWTAPTPKVPDKQLFEVPA